MRLFRHPQTLPDSTPVVALGNFDGVHRGHQAVLAEAARIAQAASAPLAVMTFYPHPREWFRPELRPLTLYPLREKLALLRQAGAQITYLLRFDAALSRMSAQDFVRTLLAGQLRARHVVTGEDFAFGKGREGNSTFLARAAAEQGFSYTGVAHLEGISSSRIRTLLREGNVQEASALLGRPYAICGHVLRGDGRGKHLGAPTANLSLSRIFPPAYGVYAIRARTQGGAWWDGVANCGIRPTFGGTAPLLEVHGFTAQENLYGQRLKVRLLHYIRPERRFENAEALAAQIGKDIVAAKQALAEL